MSKAKVSKASVEITSAKDQVIETPVDATTEEINTVVSTKPRTAKVTKTTSPTSKKTAAKPTATEIPTEATTISEATVEATSPTPTKALKIKKPKLIRDSFTFPEGDYVLIDALKLRALSQGMEFKKSEILRAGLTVLQSLSDADLAKTLMAITRIKTGRPSKK